jgi:uncharacterized protein (TIGR03437 family)
VCHKGTVRTVLATVVVALAAGVTASAQMRPDWRKVGSSSVELALASAATGAVGQVWFSADGGRLFARTLAGRTYVTSDFETWSPATDALPASPEGRLQPAEPARLPEAGALAVMAAPDRAHIYAIGQHLFRSEDGGRSWTNLTQFRSASVVGSGQHSLAVSPLDTGQLVLANDYGVWRSMDGGLTWAGLNQFLPNLPVRRILATQGGTSGTRVAADGLGTLELPPGGAVWFPARDTQQTAEEALLAQYSRMTGAQITAIGAGGSTVYAGSADGRIWVSLDAGATFRASRSDVAGAVERFYVDPAEPRVALAALSGSGPRVLRTTSSGSLWDDLTGNLPDAPVHGIAADRVAGAVYAATGRGVFLARTDLENATQPAANWVSLGEGLPAADAWDVRLDPAGVQLYVAMDGYGLYATAAPHRLWNLRIVSTADFTARPAAPGALLSVIGGHVNTVRGGDLSYPVLSASERESQIQVPFEAVGPNVALSLETSAGRVTVGLPVQPTSPAIFVGSDGVPMLYDADSGLPLDARNAAHSNGRIQILATGLGKVRPDWPANLPAPRQNPPAVAASVRIYLDGSPLQVTRATLAPDFIGFYLIEAQLPPVANLGTSELYISAEGQESNRVQIVVEP